MVLKKQQALLYQLGLPFTNIRSFHASLGGEDAIFWLCNRKVYRPVQLQGFLQERNQVGMPGCSQPS